MKAKTIGYYKNVQNVGDVNAAVDLKVRHGCGAESRRSYCQPARL